SELVDRQYYNVYFHLFMWLFAFNQFSELFRLADKYHKIEELESKLNMNKLITLFIVFSLFYSCGSRKVEIEKMQKERTELITDYESRISVLNQKITSLEKVETESSTQLEQNKKQIEKLKKERSELIDKLNEERRDDIIIKDPTGKVVVTDKEGNRYEIEGGKGTEIMKTSLSVISRQLEQRTESLMKEQETVQKLTLIVQAKETTIKEMQSEIDAKNNIISAKEKQLKEKELECEKETERKAYPVWLWLGIGFVSCVVLQLLWKLYKPRLKL